MLLLLFEDTLVKRLLWDTMIPVKRLQLAGKITSAFLIACLLYFLAKIIFARDNTKALDRLDAALNPSNVSNSEQVTPETNHFKISRRQRVPVDCSLLFQDDQNERLKAERFQESNPKKAIPESEYIARTQDCQRFTRESGYYMTPPLPGEEDFPLAFSILIYRDVEQFERLLRAIYRPQNFYCVHVDKKSSSDLHLAVKSIARCFSNAFVLEHRVDVVWGNYSVLEPDIMCMEALLKYKKWKYFINLTGQEFPLKTNWELVQILKVINGSNLVDATMKWANPERFEGRPPPPINVTVYKGSAHAIIRREFAEYVTNDENARRYLNWLKSISVPDEYLFSTLNHNPHLKIPGSYLGTPETTDKSYNYPFINRYKIWANWEGYVCSGKYVRTVCVFGVGDLPRLAATKHLIANKFNLDYQPLALDCLEQLMHSRTRAELHGPRFIDLSYYRNLQVTRNHI